MFKLYKIYDSANIVATLWCIAPLLPIGLFVADGKNIWIKYLSAVLIFILGFSVTEFRKMKIKESKWGCLDFVVYIAIPGSLFSVSLVGVLTQTSA